MNGADELPGDLSGTVGVTAGASAPEDLVSAVIERLAPAAGVEEVKVTEEDEYFPPPRDLRDLLAAVEVASQLAIGTPGAAAPASEDRHIDASSVLKSLAADAGV